MDQHARFWSQVQKGPDCWEWQGPRNHDGYGVYYLNGTRVRAHRFSLLLLTETPPFDGALALHSCDNPPCVNPAHLRWGTHADNKADAVRRGRVATGPRVTRCPQGHDLTDPANVYTWREKRGYIFRYCRACQRARKAAARKVRPNF